MQKNTALRNLDSELCKFIQKNISIKKEESYQSIMSKKEINLFYLKMLQKKTHEALSKIHEDRVKTSSTKFTRAKSQIQPYGAAINPSKKQGKEIIAQLDKVECIKMINKASFSEVQSTKQKKYFIAHQVKEILDDDIKKLIKQKQFQLGSPMRQSTKCGRLQYEQMIMDYNKILTKYKNNKINVDCNANVIERENQFNNFVSSVDLDDRKLHMISLFKKLFIQTRPQTFKIDKLQYVAKFNKPKLTTNAKMQQAKKTLSILKHSNSDQSKSIGKHMRIEQNMRIEQRSEETQADGSIKHLSSPNVAINASRSLINHSRHNKQGHPMSKFRRLSQANKENILHKTNIMQQQP